MLVSEFGRGVAISTVALALLLHWPNMPLLIGAAVIEEILEVFSTLAERRYVSSLVGQKQASSALVRMEARTHVVVLAGRPLGGFLFALMPTLPFVADTLSFAVSVGALIRIKRRQAAGFAAACRAKVFSISPLIDATRKDKDPAAASHDAAGNYCRPVPGDKLRNDICAGLRWMHNDRFTRTTVALSAGTTFICQALIMVFLANAHRHHLSPLVIGVALAASGLGGAFGSLIASRLPAPTRRPWTLIRRYAWIFAVVVLVISKGLPSSHAAFVLAVLGFTGALGNVELGTYLIQKAPEDMLARVTSVGRFISFGACAVGPIVGGVAIQEYKIRGAVLLLSAAISAMFLFSLLMPSERAQRNRLRNVLGNFVRCAARLSDAVQRSAEVLSGCAAVGTLVVMEVRREKWGDLRPMATAEFSETGSAATAVTLGRAISAEPAPDAPILVSQGQPGIGRPVCAE